MNRIWFYCGEAELRGRSEGNGFVLGSGMGMRVRRARRRREWFGGGVC